jgi:RND family efflux transporter MFP subunit
MSSDLLRRILRHKRLLAVIAVSAAGLGLVARGGTDTGRPDPITVEREDLVLEVEVEGELAAVRSGELGPPAVNEWQFKIAFLAPEGSEVKKGEPVLGFTTETLQRLLDQKTAELAEAEKKLEQKQVDVRMKTLELEQQIAQVEADRGKAQLKADVPVELLGRVEAEKARLDFEGRKRDVENLQAERTATLARGESEQRSLLAQRDRARGRVLELKTAIDRMTIRAPQDGMVLHKADWRDEKKKVGDQVWRGDTVVSIPDLSEMRADATVDEADGGQVAVGQPVKLRLEARPDLDLRGKVRSIAQTVRRKSWRVPTKVFKVDIELERTDPAVMRPAMRFRGEVETGRLPGRLVVPRDAVFLREAGPVVFVRRTLGWTEAPVKLGRSNRRQVEVLEGLTEGDRVLPMDLAAPPPAAGSGPPVAGGGAR